MSNDMNKGITVREAR